MDMTLDENYREFMNNPIEGERYAEWKRKQITKQRHLQEKEREAETNETEH